MGDSCEGGGGSLDGLATASASRKALTEYHYLAHLAASPSM